MPRPISEIMQDIGKTATEMEGYDRAALLFEPIIYLSDVYMNNYASKVSSFEEAQFAQRMDRAVRDVRNACLSGVVGIAAGMIAWPLLWGRILGTPAAVAAGGGAAAAPVAAEGAAAGQAVARAGSFARFIKWAWPNGVITPATKIVLNPSWGAARNWITVKAIQGAGNLLVVNPISGAALNAVGLFGKDVKIRGALFGEALGVLFMRHLEEFLKQKLALWRLDTSAVKPFLGLTKKEIIQKNDAIEKQVWWQAVEQVLGGPEKLRKAIASSASGKSIAADPQGVMGQETYLQAKALQDMVLRQFWTDCYAATNPVRYDINVSYKIAEQRLRREVEELAAAEAQMAGAGR
jgi:hypothetical protein